MTPTGTIQYGTGTVLCSYKQLQLLCLCDTSECPMYGKRLRGRGGEGR